MFAFFKIKLQKNKFKFSNSCMWRLLFDSQSCRTQISPSAGCQTASIRLDEPGMILKEQGPIDRLEMRGLRGQHEGFMMDFVVGLCSEFVEK